MKCRPLGNAGFANIPATSPCAPFSPRVAMGRKDYKAAVQQLRNALEFEPENVVVAEQPWVGLGRDGRSEGSRIRGEGVCARAQHRGGLNDTYGWLLVQKGETARGIELLAGRVSSLPTTPPSVCDLRGRW